MELLIISIIFAVVWLMTTAIFIVMYKKKQNMGDNFEIDRVIDNQKEQNLFVNNMLMQALKNSEASTQNTIMGIFTRDLTLATWPIFSKDNDVIII